MILLTNKQKEYIGERLKGTIIINEKKYFFKSSNKYRATNELITESIAKYMGIKCHHCEIVIINNMYYILSEDINNTLTFMNANELGINANDLYSIWNYLENHELGNIKDIMYKIIKIYLFDIFIMYTERHLLNWGFTLKDGKIEDVYIIDNDVIFDSESVILSSKFSEMAMGIHSSLLNLDNFINESSKEYINLLLDYNNKLNPDIIKYFLNKLNINDDYINNILDKYNVNYNKINVLLRDKNIK